MKITGTFLDEISNGIPHQNWGPDEWDKDFAAMKHIGIDSVFMIRCGYQRFMTYPSQILEKEQNCYRPPLDLVELFLNLAEKYSMRFFFGTYDSGKYFTESDLALGCQVVDEVWEKYGHHRSFSGWYLNPEIGCKTPSVKLIAELGRYCKKISKNLPVMISPFMLGKKLPWVNLNVVVFDNIINLSEHERNWNSILPELQGAVDIVAFQDGNVEFDELPDYFGVNRALAEKYGMECWTNCESLERIGSLSPIKWEKMLLKLEAARAAGLAKAITFEFSHFMSPNSCFWQAHDLYKRYCEHFNIAK